MKRTIWLTLLSCSIIFICCTDEDSDTDDTIGSTADVINYTDTDNTTDSSADSSTDSSSADSSVDGSVDGSSADSSVDGSSDMGMVCMVLQEGTWDISGSSFGMNMDGTLTLDSTGCAFSFSDWNMNMDVPLGGTVSGDQVTLDGTTGGRDWGNCVGTASSETSVSGECSDDGASFDMVAR